MDSRSQIDRALADMQQAVGSGQDVKRGSAGKREAKRHTFSQRVVRWTVR